MGYAELSNETRIFGIDVFGAEILWTSILGLVCVVLTSAIEIRKRRTQSEPQT